MKSTWFYILVFIAAWAHAQVEFTTSVSRERIALNERMRVEFKMNVNGNDFTPPNFVGFQVVGGPSQSFSQQWINGKGSMTKSFTYILKPNKTGKQYIKPATMNYEGKTYSTKTVEINVTGAVNKPKNINDTSPRADETVHLVAEISNANPYLNEAIRVVYKLYVSNTSGVNDWREVNSPKYADFWSDNIDNRNSLVKEGTYKGKPYRYKVLREAILYPQKTGKLIIEPLTLEVDVVVPTGQRSFTGRPYMTTEQITVSAGKRTIDVKDLPLDGRPANFNGAVGQFEFQVETDQVQIEAGESMTASVQVGGVGNLKLMDLPELKAPKSLEVYEPERINNVRTSITGMRGNIKDKYTIVPQYSGKYVIPPVEFSYFDPKKESYVSLNSGEILLQVEGDVAAPIATTENKNVITQNNQFVFIKTDTELTSQNEEQFFGSTKYWITLGGIFLLLPLFLIVKKRKESRAADVVGNRLRNANKLSKKYLSTARKNLGNHEEFYVALEKSLHNYLKSKLSISTSEMTKNNVGQLLLDRGATVQTKQEFIKLLESCEFARYTPSTPASMREDYEKASQVLNLIDKQLKS
ncbi:BatD family protein [Nonlabens tegetincola]|uniref:BatD family protein n=1 Tax=Nonlabens tegetincola TaxID=323273 RepID=UPI000CF48E65|nr:BatD family protein [Nonlabens tegetincola]PQJ20260.1 BatD protein [Nonlabens tegetincola]